MNKFIKNKGRTFIFIVNICLLSLLVFHECSAQILDSRGRVRKEAVEIFRQYKPLIEERSKEITEKKGLSKENIDKILNRKTPVSAISVNDLNDIAQVVFVRPATMERKDTKPVNKIFLPYTNQKVSNLFRAIGDINTVYPRKKSYRYLFINGSTVRNMRHLLHTLVELIDHKRLIIKKDTEIVFLTGERDLYPEKDEGLLTDLGPFKQNSQWQQPAQFPKTEDKAAEWIWYQSALPCALNSVKVTFVRAKKKEVIDPQTKQVTLKRPTRIDTVTAWVKDEKPEPGTCLSISNQPYVHYHIATIKRIFKQLGLLDKGFSIDGMGLAKKDQTLETFKDSIAVVLDNFARTLYEEVQMLKPEKPSNTHQRR